MDNPQDYIELAGLALEIGGVLVILAGSIYASVVAAWRRFGGSTGAVYEDFRRQLGRGILLGLEFLVAGDIINTVAIEPSYESVGVLAIVVLIRTFLSFTLEVEMTGRWPWQATPGPRQDDASPS